MSSEDFPLNDPFIVLRDAHLDIGDRTVGGPHPHAGFETVTLILDGAIYDRDEGGVIEADQVQWLTAGRGIIHGENVMTKGEGSPAPVMVDAPEEPAMDHSRLSDDPSGCRTRPPGGWCGGQDIQRCFREPPLGHAESSPRHHDRDHIGPAYVYRSGVPDVVQRLCIPY